MRNLKKFLALALAMLMVVSASAAVSAFDDVAEDNAYAAAIDKLVEYGITTGATADTYEPEADVLRYQMALFMARSLQPDKSWDVNGMSIFEDVTEYTGAITYAWSNGIVTGVSTEPMLFAPNEQIKYCDALIMAVRALGYKVDVPAGESYWVPSYIKAEELGLTKNITTVDKADEALNRAETAQVIYNMLKATPADGGDPIEAKNFGVATVNNTTTVVVTATENQAYSDSAKAAEAGYVGIQTIVNGIPSGEIIYLPVEVLGIEEGKADDYFGYAFDLVNFNAKTGEFVDIIPGKEPVVAYNKDISGKDNKADKFKFDGVTYYAVDAITGAALKNEIVIFNGGQQAVASKMLITNKDGDIVDENARVIAAFAYETATGAKYYFDGKNADGTNSKKVISEAVATERYGVIVDNDTYMEYQTLEVDALNSNYQITFFDDDRDEKFDRAIVTDVYAAAFNPKGGDGKEKFGPMTGETGVKYSESLTKGQVFTYTYNKQTKYVTVLEVIDEQHGTLTRINTTKNNKDNKWAVTLTIDGEDYVLGNADREDAGLTGASIYDKANGTFDKVKSDAQLGYYYDLVGNDGANGLSAGTPIKFYAIDNTIITAKSYKIDDVYDRVVLKELTSYDTDGALVADLYLNGKLIEDAVITVVDGKNLSELSLFQLSKLMSDDEFFAAGNVFRAVKLADGSYQISEEFDRTSADSRKAFGLTTMPYDQLLTFDDGIMDIGTAGTLTPAERDVFIRTKDSTVFYFLKYNAKGEITGIATYVGAPDNSSIDCRGNDVAIYADKIGYGSNSYNGVANVLFVYYADSADIKGFGVANVEYNTAYIFGSGKIESYNYASAASLGLIGSEYTGKYYYEYSVTGIDMADGSKITKVFYDKDLEAGQFVTISKDNVVVSTNVTVKSAQLASTDFVQNRYYAIANGAIANGTGSDGIKITKVILTKDDGYDIATDDVAKKLGTTASTVCYIENFADGSFVGVVTTPAAPTPAEGEVSIKVNAKYTTASADNCANFTSEVKDGKLSGTIIITSKGFTSWNDNVTAPKVSFGPANYTISSITVDGSAKDAADYVFGATVKDGNLNVTLKKAMNSALDTEALANGTYVVTIANDVVATDFIEISFIVG